MDNYFLSPGKGGIRYGKRTHRTNRETVEKNGKR
jgi:hypothetical protein